MVPLARKNLFEDIPRFLVAQTGIIFAVSLVTIQIGILRGFIRSTALLITESKADIWVASKDMVNFELTSSIPYDRLAQAQAVQGVERAEALLVEGGMWRSPSNVIDTVRLIGVNPDSQLFTPGTLVQGSLNDLKQPYTIITDETDLQKLNLKQVGDTAIVGSHPAKLVGITQSIQSNVSSPFLLTSLETAKSYYSSRLVAASAKPTTPSLAPLTSQDSVTYVLIRAKPGQDLHVLKQRLNDALPDTQAYTTAEMASVTQAYWQDTTSIGFILGLGAGVGVIVGMIVVSQILYSSVSDHLREFGTLKALGASNQFACRVIVEQALWMAILGYVPGIGLCYGVGIWTLTTQGVLILITPNLAVGVFAVTVVMCVSSALFAIQKVTCVDPAIVFKA